MLLTTASAEHQVVLEYWLERLTRAEFDAPTDADADMAAAVAAALATATDVPGLLRAVREICVITGDTYLNASQVLVGRESLVMAAELAALDVARTGVIDLLLGEPALPAATHTATAGFEVPGQ